MFGPDLALSLEKMGTVDPMSKCADRRKRFKSSKRGEAERTPLSSRSKRGEAERSGGTLRPLVTCHSEKRSAEESASAGEYHRLNTRHQALGTRH